MTVLQSLDGYYSRMAERGDVVPPGYSKEPIGLVLTLAAGGTLVDVVVRLDANGKKPKTEQVPKWFGRSGQGSTPYFLWDNTAYALGVSTKDPGKTARDHASFKALHLDVLADETDEGLIALCFFLQQWEPDRFSQAPFKEKMLAWNVAFRFDGPERQLIHERPAAMACVDRMRIGTAPERSQPCLVTGATGPVVRLHPKIKGVDGTASAEVPLVSFNEAAFESYGCEQGDNAPTSVAAAFRYGAALNGLLDRGNPRNRLRIGDSTVAFWADTSGVGEVSALAAEAACGFVLGDIAAEDADEAWNILNALKAVADGRPLSDASPKLDPLTRFHVLGLSPNAARLSVRYWLDDDFGTFARRLARHLIDLDIQPSPWGNKPPSIQRLLVKTAALLEKFDNIPPLLAGEVMRAVLTGAQYPRNWLSAVIIRLRAGDDPTRGWHAAAIKACLNRSGQEILPMGLDPDNENVAYQLGRLFAVLEDAQRAALGRVNASVVDRYYGAASATPARVFPPLLRGLRHHISDARKQGKGGWIDHKVGEIMAKLPPDLPRTLRLEDQGRFAVGYYHQHATPAARRAEVEMEAVSES